MAKTSKIVKNEKRMRIARRCYERRMELKRVILNPEATPEEKDEAYLALRKMPRDANPNRITQRCRLTGRPRGVFRKFGLSRIALREMASQGLLPGVTKSSW